jgi:peptidoglycan/LPS O-acetylase OafA/YrhL
MPEEAKREEFAAFKLWSRRMGMMLTKKGEIASLTGLRGLAALLVVTAHYWPWTRVTQLEQLPTEMASWMETSGIGMAIFFTLSGYVIALSYGHWNWRQRPGFNLARFFFYRFARLYPAFLLFAILVVLRWPVLQDFGDSEAAAYLVPHLLLVQSWWPTKFGGTLVAEDHFHVSWSLSVECALYLGFGLGMIGAAMLPRGHFRSLLFGATLLIGLIGGWFLLDSAWLLGRQMMPSGWSDLDWYLWLHFYSPWGPALQFGIGIAAYALSRTGVVKHFGLFASELGGLGLVTVYLYFAIYSSAVRFDQTVLASLATAFVLVGALSHSITNRLLSGRAIIYLGTISYSLYLFHFMTPAIAVHGRFFESYTFTAGAFHAINFLTSFALAIVIATGVYRLVEVPGRRIIRAMADRLLGLRRASLPMAQGSPAE